MQTQTKNGYSANSHWIISRDLRLFYFAKHKHNRASYCFVFVKQRGGHRLPQETESRSTRVIRVCLLHCCWPQRRTHTRCKHTILLAANALMVSVWQIIWDINAPGAGWSGDADRGACVIRSGPYLFWRKAQWALISLAHTYKFQQLLRANDSLSDCARGSFCSLWIRQNISHCQKQNHSAKIPLLSEFIINLQ